MRETDLSLLDTGKYDVTDSLLPQQLVDELVHIRQLVLCETKSRHDVTYYMR